ncbi:MAG: RNA polymerase sigma-70 factor [Pedobacter sp.]|uniref:RNA polymerase sigma-70 factor n=1 Tax=Pedobacter sp. TaxID=1411316 RepID=UPI003563F048
MDISYKIDEDELTSRLNSGDEHSYDYIFKLYYKPLCFFAYKILQDSTKAEDIVQDNLIKLWERRQTFDHMEKIRAFLYVCVRNSCYDELQHQKVMNKHAEYFNNNSEILERTILDTIMQAEVVRKVFATVDTLPEQCRKVIKMTFEEGRSPKEIAEELGVTVSTVSNQKMRGLILLKKRLSDQDVAMAIVILLPAVIFK